MTGGECLTVKRACDGMSNMTTTQKVPANEIRKGDYLTHGFDRDMCRKWSPISQVQHLKSGRVALRLSQGAWGATERGTYQNRFYFDADELVEVAR